VLLTYLLDRPDRSSGAEGAHRVGRERGSALASVVAVLAITGIVAASLVAATVFGMRTSSGTRAHVQSQTAAEGGLDAAKATLATCGADTVTSPVGTSPRYSVEIWNRVSENATWLRGCPTTDSVQVRLVSSGYSDAKAINGQVRSDVTTMESIVRKVPAVFAGRDLTVASSFAVNPSGPTDMVVNGDYRCSDSGASLTHTGLLFLGDENVGAGSCLSQGPLRSGATYDEASQVNAFPRYTQDHTRFSYLGAGVNWFSIPNAANPGWVNACTMTGSGYTTITSSGGNGKIVTSANCPGGLSVDPLWNLEFVLGGDVVVFVERFTLRGTLTVRSGDGKPHSLSIVRPWAADQDCRPQADIQLAGGTVVQSDALTRVMLYSSNAVEIGQDPVTAPATRPTQTIRGQVYGCDIRVWDPTTLTFAAAGGTATPRPWSAVELLSKRDEAG
jgi:Tfp pilus assembly protein PilX